MSDSIEGVGADCKISFLILKAQHNEVNVLSVHGVSTALGVFSVTPSPSAQTFVL